MRETWRRHIVGLLDQALERNDGAISAVAAAITTTILAGRHVYAFGAGHSLALVSEMHRRAGWRPGDMCPRCGAAPTADRSRIPARYRSAACCRRVRRTRLACAAAKVRSSATRVPGRSC